MEYLVLEGAMSPAAELRAAVSFWQLDANWSLIFRLCFFRLWDEKNVFQTFVFHSAFFLKKPNPFLLHPFPLFCLSSHSKEDPFHVLGYLTQRG
jgi:hypothetical protein